MLQVARLAPNALQEAREPVLAFVREQMHEDGGARNRAGESDLYYAVFALECLIALQAELPAGRVRAYLERFGEGGELDLVHLACLARCWAALPPGSLSSGTASGIARRIASHRVPDGGFHSNAAAETGTVYHAFLALGALQDLGAAVDDAEGLRRSVASLGRPDGSFSNAHGVTASSTPTTAAAVTLLRQLGSTAPAACADWLLGRAHPEGGFFATDGAPLPDLLSTATALHALAGMQVPFSGLREPMLDFLDTLWTGRSFCGSWADDTQDCEYTYYALLALGHLSLA